MHTEETGRLGSIMRWKCKRSVLMTSHFDCVSSNRISVLCEITVTSGRIKDGRIVVQDALQ